MMILILIGCIIMNIVLSTPTCNYVRGVRLIAHLPTEYCFSDYVRGSDPFEYESYVYRCNSNKDGINRVVWDGQNCLQGTPDFIEDVTDDATEFDCSLQKCNIGQDSLLSYNIGFDCSLDISTQYLEKNIFLANECILTNNEEDGAPKSMQYVCDALSQSVIYYDDETCTTALPTDEVGVVIFEGCQQFPQHGFESQLQINFCSSATPNSVSQYGTKQTIKELFT
eukprot:UN00457